jgi:hypothetical protein
MGKLLRHGADDFDVDRLRQPRQLLQRIGRRPGLTGTLDGDEEGMLGGAVCRKWDACNGDLS